MNIIKQIIAEIERLRATNPSEYNEQNAIGYVWALNDILSFIDTLESEKPIPTDLFKAKHAFSEERFPDEKMAPLRRAARIGYEAGAKWQKEQMMKEAVEGEVTYDILGYNNAVRAGVFNTDFKYGDKVRIIIVKED